MQVMIRAPETYPTPVGFSVPQELTISNILKVDKNLVGIVVVSKFAEVTYTGASAIEFGPVQSVLLGLSHILESSYFFRFRIIQSQAEGLKIRDDLRSEIVVRALGE